MNNYTIQYIGTKVFSISDTNYFKDTVSYYNDPIWKFVEPVSENYLFLYWNDGSFGEDIDKVKTFLLRKIKNHYSLLYVSNMYSCLRLLYINTNKLGSLSSEYVETANNKVLFDQIVGEYLKYIEYPDNNIIDLLKKKVFKYNDARDVASFKTLFKLERLINRFYYEADPDDLLYYFPILLWWKIGAAFPMRSSEFCYIKRNCLIANKDTYFFEIPTIKQRFSDSVRYDYFAIDSNIAELIIEYQKMTQFDNSEYLFSIKVYQSRQKFQRGSSSNRTKLGRREFGFVLNSFFTEIIDKKYHMNIVEKNCNDVSTTNELIENIQLGDLRHYTMYNMVAAGLDPYTIKKMARHESLESQVHYYKHIYNMSMGKIEVLADEMLSHNFGGINCQPNRNCNIFKEREMILLDIEREEKKNSTCCVPVIGGLCPNALKCNDFYDDCAECVDYIPNDYSEFRMRQIERLYSNEITALNDICKSIELIYRLKGGKYSDLEYLSNRRESSIARIALLKTRIVKGDMYGKTEEI